MRGEEEGKRMVNLAPLSFLKVSAYDLIDRQRNNHSEGNSTVERLLDQSIH